MKLSDKLRQLQNEAINGNLDSDGIEDGFNRCIENAEYLERSRKIEELLDMNDIEIQRLHSNWDKGDCSLVGLAEIFLHQCIKKHKEENGEHYDTDYDQIKLRC